jgi:hypothetical protein
LVSLIVDYEHGDINEFKLDEQIHEIPKVHAVLKDRNKDGLSPVIWQFCTPVGEHISNRLPLIWLRIQEQAPFSITLEAQIGLETSPGLIEQVRRDPCNHDDHVITIVTGQSSNCSEGQSLPALYETEHQSSGGIRHAFWRDTFA